MRLIYVSGPYRGDVEKNIEVADRVGREIAAAGDWPFIPHNNTAGWEHKTDLTPEQYIQGDLLILNRCDAVVMLPGWENSEGARAERECALHAVLPVYYWPDYPPINSEPNRERYPLSDFMAQVAKRLEKGAVEYGAESYLSDNVTRQIEEELLDIAGWASLGWAKLKRVEELWKELDKLVKGEVE